MARCGTAAGYKRGCRCDACRDAYRVAAREYMRSYRQGKRTRVRGDEVHRHIGRLRGAGLSVEAIAKAADLPPETVHKLVRERSRTLWPKTANAILAVTLDAKPPNSVIPKEPARRLIEQLLEAGVPAEEIERRIGWRERNRWSGMRETTFRKVKLLYLAFARQGAVPADLLEEVAP